MIQAGPMLPPHSLATAHPSGALQLLQELLLDCLRNTTWKQFWFFDVLKCLKSKTTPEFLSRFGDQPRVLNLIKMFSHSELFLGAKFIRRSKIKHALKKNLALA